MNHEKRNELLAAEAADWVISLADANHQTRAAFAQWLRASPENIREFLAVSSIWGMLPDVAEQPSVEELVDFAAKQSKVVALRGADRSERRPIKTRRDPELRWLGRVAAITLAVLSAAFLVWNFPSAPVPELHATVTGEQSAIPLSDGSMVSLNTRSSLQVAFSNDYRDVELTQGEAFFDVAYQATRPFRVITEQAIILAVGTQFNVRADTNEVTVTVAEGAVDVSSRLGASETRADSGRGLDGSNLPGAVRIKVGQQALVRSGYQGADVRDGSIEKATAWRQHRLIFEDQPLEQIIREFNRYNEPAAVIRDEQLKSIKISGVFRSNDRASFLQYLAEMELADFVELKDGTVVLTDTRNQ